MGKNQHVVPHKDGWAVRGEGNEKVTSISPTQRQAIEEGRMIAQHKQAELVIHGRDGKIRDKHSFGRDPYPPRDKKH